MPREWLSDEDRIKMLELALENAGISIPVPCNQCSGSGYQTHDNTTSKCEFCNGKGILE